MSSTAEKDTLWEVGVKNIAFNYSHLFINPIEQYFSIELDAERPLVFKSYLRMNAIPRNELIALYTLIYD
jgi:hypothetical protein